MSMSRRPSVSRRSGRALPAPFCTRSDTATASDDSPYLRWPASSVAERRSPTGSRTRVTCVAFPYRGEWWIPGNEKEPWHGTLGFVDGRLELDVDQPASAEV